MPNAEEINVIVEDLEPVEVDITEEVTSVVMTEEVFGITIEEEAVSVPLIEEVIVADSGEEAFTIDVQEDSISVEITGDIITTLLEDDVPYSKRIDFINPEQTILYRGEAVPGSSLSDTRWRIRKIEILGDGDVIETWAGGSAAFDKVWDDRTTYVYT